MLGCNDNGFSLSVKEVGHGECQEGHSPLRCATETCRDQGFHGFMASCVWTAGSPIPQDAMLALETLT